MPSPILSSTLNPEPTPPDTNPSGTDPPELPPTQSLVEKLSALRSVEGIDAVSLKRENDELKSKNVALMLQQEEYEREIARLHLLLSSKNTPSQQIGRAHV